MNSEDKRRLRQCRVPLCRDLRVGEIRDALIQVSLFTPMELENLEQHESPMSHLLDDIERKGPDAIQLFIKALEFVDKPHLIEIINENTTMKGGQKKILQLDLPMDYKDCTLKEKEEDPNIEGASLLEKHLNDVHDNITELQTKLEKCESEYEESKTNEEKLRLKVGILQRTQKDLNAQILYLNGYVHFLAEMHKNSQAHVYTIISSLVEKIKLLTIQQEHFKMGQTYLFDQNTILLNEKQILMTENADLKIENTLLRKELEKRKQVAENNEGESSKRKKLNL
ncbi:uncharacterized protein [Antedon mediterranea]|uniref:uncharacterized protein n=1 Tax=Antedon mediterranea TaxID=105859 RepID=UPI003AFA0096